MPYFVRTNMYLKPTEKKNYIEDELEHRISIHPSHTPDNSYYCLQTDLSHYNYMYLRCLNSHALKSCTGILGYHGDSSSEYIVFLAALVLGYSNWRRKLISLKCNCWKLTQIGTFWYALVMSSEWYIEGFPPHHFTLPMTQWGRSDWMHVTLQDPWLYHGWVGI